MSIFPSESSEKLNSINCVSSSDLERCCISAVSLFLSSSFSALLLTFEAILWCRVEPNYTLSSPNCSVLLCLHASSAQRCRLTITGLFSCCFSLCLTNFMVHPVYSVVLIWHLTSQNWKQIFFTTVLFVFNCDVFSPFGLLTVWNMSISPLLWYPVKLFQTFDYTKAFNTTSECWKPNCVHMKSTSRVGAVSFCAVQVQEKRFSVTVGSLNTAELGPSLRMSYIQSSNPVNPIRPARHQPLKIRLFLITSPLKIDLSFSFPLCYSAICLQPSPELVAQLRFLRRGKETQLPPVLVVPFPSSPAHSSHFQ